MRHFGIRSGPVLRHWCKLQQLQYFIATNAVEKCCPFRAQNTLGCMQLNFFAHNVSKKILKRGLSQFSDGGSYQFDAEKNSWRAYFITRCGFLQRQLHWQEYREQVPGDDITPAAFKMTDFFAHIWVGLPG